MFTAEEDKGKVDVRTALQGICTKSHLLDLVESFILFDRNKMVVTSMSKGEESAAEPRTLKNHLMKQIQKNRGGKTEEEKQRRKNRIYQAFFAMVL